ncbi:MAG: UvrD-helicase domain-containing protein [Anaerolineae bacterium]
MIATLNPGVNLTTNQQRVVDFPRQGNASLWVHGLAGSGKTVALIARLMALLAGGARPDQILVLVSDRAQAELFEQSLARCTTPNCGGATITTFYGLCQRAVALFWPVVARAAGFAHPEREPTFLTLESTQYYLESIVSPLMRSEGYFSDLTIRRERLLSQVIDNLNKSALVGFPPQEIAKRLSAAWAGNERRYITYRQAEDCALRFRAFCLERNLLDISLTTDLFNQQIRFCSQYQAFATAQYQHLLVDNLEENVPVAFSFIEWLLSGCASSVLALDDEGSYRVFLGADWQTAAELGRRCQVELTMDTLPGSNSSLLALADGARRAMHLPGLKLGRPGTVRGALLGQCSTRYWAGIIRWMAEQVVRLVDEGCPPSDIAIMAPYVNEVMRFALEDDLERHGVKLFLLRPATTLRDDVVVRASLCLARLAHPGWAENAGSALHQLPVEDLAEALGQVIAALDPVRARILAEKALPMGTLALADLSGNVSSTASQVGALWQRLGFQLRERYQALRGWLNGYAAESAQPLDIFLSRLFGELLSLPGFGLYQRPDLARSYSRLLESAYNFRLATSADDQILELNTLPPDISTSDLGSAYTEFVLTGLASAEYVSDRPDTVDDGVILAPAYAYLTRGLRSRYQFWCDLRADGWWNRPNQPLTHPFVLSQRWPLGRPWFDADEDHARRQSLGRVLVGLAMRCTEGVFWASSELGVGGDEQSGRLERLLQNVLVAEGARGTNHDNQVQSGEIVR